MANWNHDYLSALGIPIWVSKQVAVQAAADTSDRSSEQTKGLGQPVGLVASYQLLFGDNGAKHGYLLTSIDDRQRCLRNIQQLEQAWRRWQGERVFPIQLIQLTEAGEPLNSDNFSSLFIAQRHDVDRDASEQNEQPSQFGQELRLEPTFNLDWSDAADKKAAWLFLQQLADSIA